MLLEAWELRKGIKKSQPGPQGIIAHMGVSGVGLALGDEVTDMDELDAWLAKADIKEDGLFVLGGESASKLELPGYETPLPTGSNKPNWALDSPPPLDVNSFSSPKQIFSNFKLKAAGALNGGGNESIAAFKGGVLATLQDFLSLLRSRVISLTELPKSQLFSLSLAVYVFRDKFKPTMISLIKLIKMIISGSIKLGAGQMISVRMRLRAIFVAMMRKIGRNG